MGQAQSLTTAELFQKMAYSNSLTDHDTAKEKFFGAFSKPVAEYIMTNCDPIMNQWVLGWAFSTRNFLNTTNNRRES